MAEQLLPESFGRIVADLDRRLRNLESTSRVGLNQIQTSEVAGPDSGPALLTDGTYGNLSAAGPAATVTTGVKALVIGSAVLNCGIAATYRNTGSKISYAVSGATTINPDVTSTSGQLDNGAAAALSVTVTFVDVVTLTPGTNTFTMKFAYTFPTGGGAASTIFYNMSLVVVPLDV